MKEKTSKERKDGGHETTAAPSPADCAHAHKDGKGRTFYTSGASSHPQMGNRRLDDTLRVGRNISDI